MNNHYENEVRKRRGNTAAYQKQVEKTKNHTEDKRTAANSDLIPIFAEIVICNDNGCIRKNDVVLDYGCGKGRVSFFLSYLTKAKTIGIEYDERIYGRAMENLKTARARAAFAAIRAEEFDLPPEVNRCYFFNPFSVEILRAVMARITESYYALPREILLLFYYPSDEYLCYLATVSELKFYDEIACCDLFEGKDSRDRIMIFRPPLMEGVNQ